MLNLNTKQDYLNYLTVQPEKTKKDLQLLLKTRFTWKSTGILAADAAGQVDDTHRVIGEEPERIQQELVEDTNAKLFRIGFTVAEVEEIVNA